MSSILKYLINDTPLLSGINLKSTLQKICRMMIHPVICITSYFHGCVTVLLENCWSLPGHTRSWTLQGTSKATRSMPSSQGDRFWEKTVNLYGNASFSSLLALLSALSPSCQQHAIIWQIVSFVPRNRLLLLCEPPSISGWSGTFYLPAQFITMQINTPDFRGILFLIIALVTLPSSYRNHRKPNIRFWSILEFEGQVFCITSVKHCNQPKFPISFYRLPDLAKLFLFCLKPSLHLINFIFIPQKMWLEI